MPYNRESRPAEGRSRLLLGPVSIEYYSGGVVKPLVVFKVSSRDLQLIGLASHAAQRRAHPTYNPQDRGILGAIETRIPTAHFGEKLEITCTEADVLLPALETYALAFWGKKHQALHQEIRGLAMRLANAMEGSRIKSDVRS
jgi:hypothetical protein